MDGKCCAHKTTPFRARIKLPPLTLSVVIRQSATYKDTALKTLYLAVCLITQLKCPATKKSLNFVRLYF